MKKLLLLLIAVVALGEAAADEIPAGFRPLETPTTVRPDYQVIADGVKMPNELKFFNPKTSTLRLILANLHQFPDLLFAYMYKFFDICK